MPSSKKGKKRTNSQSPLHARQSKMLYLPMPRADADAMMLRSRVVLEAARSGRADGAMARRLATVMLLTRFLTEAGHGRLELAALDAVEDALADVFKAGYETGVWTFPEAAIKALTLIVNEHDRQLLETRLEAVVAASARLDQLIERNGVALATHVFRRTQ
jgi:hypothetical protein